MASAAEERFASCRPIGCFYFLFSCSIRTLTSPSAVGCRRSSCGLWVFIGMGMGFVNAPTSSLGQDVATSAAAGPEACVPAAVSCELWAVNGRLCGTCTCCWLCVSVRPASTRMGVTLRSTVEWESDHGNGMKTWHVHYIVGLGTLKIFFHIN